jgi:KDO2-lipid IV(A) lauroyltransferase
MENIQRYQSGFFSWYHRSFIVRFLLAVMPWFMRTFSRRTLYVIRHPFTLLYYWAGTSFRRAVTGNLRAALGSSVSEKELKKITRRVFSNITKSFVDMFYVAAIPEERWGEVVEPPVGKENIARALEKGKGVILLTGHIGNWEIGGIRQNRIVTMKGDRAMGGQGITIPFFGRDAVFPKGPFLTAYITGAPILPTFVVINEHDRYVPVVEGPIIVEKTGDRARDIADAAGRVVRVIEQYIQRYPDQWYMFYPYWKGGSAEPAGRSFTRSSKPSARRSTAGGNAGGRHGS